MPPDLTSGWRPLVHKLNLAGTDTELVAPAIVGAWGL
jgi:hypothetical protein